MCCTVGILIVFCPKLKQSEIFCKWCIRDERWSVNDFIFLRHLSCSTYKSRYVLQGYRGCDHHTKQRFQSRLYKASYVRMWCIQFGRVHALQNGVHVNIANFCALFFFFGKSCIVFFRRQIKSHFKNNRKITIDGKTDSHHIIKHSL